MPTAKLPAYLTRATAATFIALWTALAAPAAVAWTPAEDARARAGEVVIHELPASEGATVQARFFVAASPAATIAVLWDHARYPEFMPHSKVSHVLEQHGNDAVVEQSGGEGPFVVSFVTRRHKEAHRITWTTLRGDVKRNEGAWDVAPAPGGTLVTYQVHVVPKGPVPQRVTAFLQKQALPAMCRAVRQRVESRAHTR